MIDEKSLDKYKRTEGSFGNRLHNSIDWEKGSFHQYERRCAFLNENNLCDLHLEVGEDMLCDTCKNYPRHREEYEGLREGSLSLSCIEAAKIVLGCKEPVQWIHFEDEEEDEEYEDFDYLLFTKLTDARAKIIDVLQNRKIDIMIRIGLILELAKDMQHAVDNGEIFKIDEMLKDFGEMEMILSFQQKMKEDSIGEHEYCGNARKMFRFFQKLEVLKEDWPEQTKRAEKMLFGEGQRAYEDNCKKFHKQYGRKSDHYEEWSAWLEQLMVYFVFVYFCGAVYDENLLGKIKSAVVITFLTQELTIAKWIENGQMSFELFVDLAHAVSREIEHSDVNLVRLEKLCDNNPILQTETLQRMILY